MGDVVELDIPIRARWTWPHPEIDTLRGQVAVERGPLVYCIESVDLGADVALSEVVADEEPGDDGVAVTVPIRLRERMTADWPYGAAPTAAASEPHPIRLVPNHTWANRGPSIMRVWIANVFTGPAWKQRGMGRAVVAEVVAAVTDGNALSERLLARLGFVRAGAL